MQKLVRIIHVCDTNKSKNRKDRGEEKPEAFSGPDFLALQDRFSRLRRRMRPDSCHGKGNCRGRKAGNSEGIRQGYSRGMHHPGSSSHRNRHRSRSFRLWNHRDAFCRPGPRPSRLTSDGSDSGAPVRSRWPGPDRDPVLFHRRRCFYQGTLRYSRYLRPFCGPQQPKQRAFVRCCYK